MSLVPATLTQKAAEAPTTRAVDVDGGSSITYAEWEARSNRLARALVAAGLEPGDRAALRISSKDAVDYGVAYFGVLKAGGIAVPLNTRLAPVEAARIIDHAEPQFVFAGRESSDAAMAVKKIAKTHPTWIARDLADGLDWAAIEAAESDAAFQVARSDEEIADILYTSGTTGFPKGVASTHADVSRLSRNRFGKAFPGAMFFHAFPTFTFAGTHGMMMIGLSGAMTTLTQAKFDADRFLELMAERSIDVAYLAPAMIRLTLDRSEPKGLSFERLQVLFYGSAAMPPDTIGRIAKLFPSAMQLNVYGLTEGGSAACFLSPEEALKRPGSIGKPAPPTELSIRSETGQELTAGQHGEIWLRSPKGRRTYYKDEAASKKAWTDDGWLRTGDIGHFDDDGYLYIDDRKNDMINRGGFNVYPAEVEAALSAHPAVREAAVVGVDHRVLGEDIEAFVVLGTGAAATPEILAAHCRERLADYKCPRRIEILDDLPRNPMGKVLKRVLRGETRSG